MEILLIKPDVQLWKDFVLGSDVAFKIIYETYVQTLFKFGLHFTKNEDLIQDCIQDLFVDLHKYRQRLKNTDNIKLYLFVSLKRKIFRALNKEEKYLQLNSENIPFFYALAENDEDDSEARRYELLEKAMRKLSNRQREAIYLRFVNGLDYDELGEILQMNYQSARNLVYRGVEKLRASCRKESLLLWFFPNW